MTITLQTSPESSFALSIERNGAIVQSTQPVYAFLSVQGDFRPEVGTDGMSQQALYLHQLALALTQHGCQVDVFVRREHPDQPEIVEHQPGCRTIRLTAGPVRRLSSNQVLEYLPTLVDAWLAFQRGVSRHYVLFQTSDWLSGWVGLYLRRLLNLPLVHTSRAICTLKYLGLERSNALSVLHSIEQTCLEQADCVVTGSPQEVADLHQIITIRGRSKVIPWGIDTQHFGALSQASARQQLCVSPETRLILYVGRFASLQGIETLVKACAFLPKPFQLYLVDISTENEIDVEEQRHIRTLIRQLELEKWVVFASMVPRSQLPAYYAAANVCVVPNYEASGSVLLESMASGTPIIASTTNSNAGGLSYVVRHGHTGLLVPLFNPDALATALWDVWTNPNAWATYALAGRHWVMSRFSYAAVSAQMYDLYQSLTQPKRGQTISLSQHQTADIDRIQQRLSRSKHTKLFTRAVFDHSLNIHKGWDPKFLN